MITLKEASVLNRSVFVICYWVVDCCKNCFWFIRYWCFLFWCEPYFEQAGGVHVGVIFLHVVHFLFLSSGLILLKE